MVPALSYEISRVSHYSGSYHANLTFIYRTFTFYGMLSQNISTSLISHFCSPNPKCISTLGLGSSYFARHYFRNRFFFLFLWVLRCFSSPRSLSYTTLLMYEYTSFFPSMSSLIRISTARWIFAPPRSFSQLITSFIGSWCQGIHPMLLVA